MFYRAIDFSGFRRNECKPLLCSGRQIGLIRDRVEKELLEFPDVFKITNDHVEINPELSDYDSRSQVIWITDRPEYRALLARYQLLYIECFFWEFFTFFIFGHMVSIYLVVRFWSNGPNSNKHQSTYNMSPCIINKTGSNQNCYYSAVQFIIFPFPWIFKNFAYFQRLFKISLKLHDKFKLLEYTGLEYTGITTFRGHLKRSNYSMFLWP